MKLNSVIAATALLCTGTWVNAQMLKDNSRITGEARKKAGNNYELVLHMKLEKGWHIYSMNPGGDGMLFGPKILFKKDPKVALQGGVQEKGKMISEVIIESDPKVNMYNDKVDYVQQAVIKGATEVSGTYQYQICNEKGFCLPPAKKEFKIVVKG